MRTVVTCAILAALGPVMLPGCTYIETRPGHPDSWQYSRYYDETRRWSVDSASPSKSGTADTTDQAHAAKSGAEDANSNGPPPNSLLSSTPNDIWKARAFAWNMHLQYSAASHKAQDRQDEFALPLFAAAIATGAVALAHASTVAVAATALGGTSLAGAYGYLHPDKDAATDLVADNALTCVVDQTHVLKHIDASPLILDKDAMQKALLKLQKDAADLMNLPSPDANQQAAIDAVKAAEEAAQKTLQSLTDAIAGYNALPSAIYGAVDAINMNAEVAGARMIDTSSLTKDVKSSAATQASTEIAQSTLNEATVKAEVAKAKGQAGPAAKKSGAAAKVLGPKGGAAAGDDAQDDGTTVSGGAAPAGNAPTEADLVTEVKKLAPEATATNTTDPPGKTAKAEATKTETLNQILSSDDISDVTTILQIGQMAIDDTPSPNFSDIAAAVNTCATSQK